MQTVAATNALSTPGTAQSPVSAQPGDLFIRLLKECIPPLKVV